MGSKTENFACSDSSLKILATAFACPVYPFNIEILIQNNAFLLNCITTLVALTCENASYLLP